MRSGTRISPKRGAARFPGRQGHKEDAELENAQGRRTQSLSVTFDVYAEAGDEIVIELSGEAIYRTSLDVSALWETGSTTRSGTC